MRDERAHPDHASTRLKNRRDFLRVQRRGCRATTHTIVMIAVPSNKQRVGLTVAKTVGKAHVRNLVKRRLRHLLRKHSELLTHKDIVIIARPSSALASFEEMESDFTLSVSLVVRKLSNESARKFNRSKNRESPSP